MRHSERPDNRRIRWNLYSSPRVIINICSTNVYTHTYIPAHISHLPMKEFGNINQLQYNRHGHPVLYIIVGLQFHILVSKGNNGHRPKHHPTTTIGHLFAIECQETEKKIRYSNKNLVCLIRSYQCLVRMVWQDW